MAVTSFLIFVVLTSAAFTVEGKATHRRAVDKLSSEQMEVIEMVHNMSESLGRLNEAEVLKLTSLLVADGSVEGRSIVGNLLSNVLGSSPSSWITSSSLTSLLPLQNMFNAAKVKCVAKLRNIPLVKSTEGLYYFENATMLNWVKAQEFCTRNGMELVTINSASENYALKTRIRDLMDNNNLAANSKFLIGLTNLGEAAPTIFSWIGTGQPVGFTNWHAGQPTLTASFCGAISQTNLLLNWETVDCLTAANFFICEVDDVCKSILHSNNGIFSNE